MKWFTLGIQFVNAYKACKEVCFIILRYCLKEKSLINMSVVIYIFNCILSSFPVLDGWTIDVDYILLVIIQLIFKTESKYDSNFIFFGLFSLEKNYLQRKS